MFPKTYFPNPKSLPSEIKMKKIVLAFYLVAGFFRIFTAYANGVVAFSEPSLLQGFFKVITVTWSKLRSDCDLITAMDNGSSYCFESSDNGRFFSYFA